MIRNCQPYLLVKRFQYAIIYDILSSLLFCASYPIICLEPDHVSGKSKGGGASWPCHLLPTHTHTHTLLYKTKNVFDECSISITFTFLGHERCSFKAAKKTKIEIFLQLQPF